MGPEEHLKNRRTHQRTPFTNLAETQMSRKKGPASVDHLKNSRKPEEETFANPRNKPEERLKNNRRTSEGYLTDTSGIL